MSTTTIIAVRHGETEWNKTGKQQGHLNSDLTPLGVQQALAMAEGLRDRRIDRIYSSDLGRATQTAAIIAREIGVEFTTDVRLRERNLGILQGITKKEFAVAYPEDAARLNSYDPDYRLPQGESIRDRYERCVACAEDLAHRHPGARILLVGHGGVLMSFIHRALQLPLTQKRSFSLYNGSINAFSVDERNQWALEVWGDVSHMARRGLSYIDDN